MALFATLLSFVPFTQQAAANHGTCILNVEPENDVNPVGAPHQLTATLVPAGANVNNPPGNTTCNGATGPVNVDFEVICQTPGVAGDCTPDPSYQATQGGTPNAIDEADTPAQPDLSCTIPQGQASCQVSYTRNDAGTDQIRGYVDENADNNPANDDPAAQDVVNKTWQARQAQRLDCTPDTATNPAQDNPATGATNETSETYTCTVLDQFGEDPGNPGAYEIDIEETDDGDGAAAPVDFDNCGNGANATGNRNNNVCTFTVVSTNNADDVRTFCAFIDNDATDDNVEAECPEPVTPDDTDEADSFQKTYTAVQANNLDANPETATNNLGANDTTHTINCDVFNNFGGQQGTANQGTGNTTCFFEFLGGSPSDPAGDGGSTPQTPDGQCNTNTGPGAAAGTNATRCTFTYNFGGNTLVGGTDTICVYMDPNDTTATGTTCDDANDAQNAEGLTDPTGDQAANSTATTELGGTGPAGNNNAGNDQVDVVQKQWTAAQAQNQGAAQTIDAEPESDTNNMAAGDNTHTIFVIARDVAGNATQGQTTTPPGNQPGSTTRVRADIISGPNAVNQTQAEINCTLPGNQQANQVNTGQAPSATNRTHQCTYNQNIDGVNNEVGTDQIVVFYDTNDNGIYDGANCGQNNQTGEPCDQVAKTWVSGPANLTMTPDNPTTAAGVCQFFTVTVTQNVNGTNQPVPNQTIDVLAVFQNPPAAGQPNQPDVQFCNPGAGAGPGVQPAPNTQTPAGGTSSAPPGGIGGQNPPPGGAPNQRHGEFTTDANGQVTFGVLSTQPGTVSVTSFIDVNNNNTPDDPIQDTSTMTVGPGGQQGARTVEATPPSAQNPLNTTHVITVTVRGQGTGGQPGPLLAGVQPSAQVTSTQNGGNPNAVLQCTTTNNQGQATCSYQGVNAGTDTITVWVNQTPPAGTPSTAGPDEFEPKTTVTKTWTAAQAGFSIDVTCTGQGTGDDRDVGELGVAGTEAGGGDATADCRNPLTSTSVTFRATVIQADSADAGPDPDPAAGVRVHWTINVQGANTADVAFAPGSTTAGANTVQCTTDASGTCEITVNNPTPSAGDQVRATGTVAGQTVPLTDIDPNTNGNQPGTSGDTATKEWQAAAASAITLTPAAATNQVGQNHTVTATVTNQFGQGVTTNGTVDFRVISGPNVGRQQLDTPLSGTGTATFTYTSNVAGDDVIQACLEIPGQGEDDNCVTQGQGQEANATAFKRWQTTAVAPNAVGLDMDADDPNANTGCELTSATDANRETTATNNINPTRATDPGNFHRVCAAAFQTGQNVGTQGRIPGASITFSSTGAGRLFAADAAGNCNTTVAPAAPAQTSITTTADQNGFAYACLFSQTAGQQNITASSGTPAQTATGTKEWRVSPARARFIQLCHGDIAGATCDTAPATNEPGDDHQLTARVTDAQGNPVAGVPVQFRETGPAIFTPQGGSSATVNTDANGLASVIMTSDVQGTSTVVAEIDPAGQAAPGGVARTPGATGDECESGAGTGGTPAAGNCTSQTLTKTWEPIVIEPECNDGEDNDGDGFIDFGTAETNDPGCSSATDDSEDPFNPRDPEEIVHGRRISIRFNDGTGARNNGLVVFGRLRLAGDGTNPDCIRQVPVNIQRRINGRWVTKKSTDTNRRGRYAVEIFDQASRYRAVAPRVDILDEDLNQLHICQRTAKVKRHRHRR